MAEEAELAGTGLGANPKAAGAAAPLDPMAAALAARAPRGGAGLDPELKAYLKQQGRLVEIQTEHLHEQRAVLISQMKLRRAIDRFKLALQAIIAVIAAGLAVGLVVLVVQAANARGLVIEPFSVPPDLAARGLGGEVVAAQIEDRLAALQAGIQSARAADTYSNDWGGDTKVEIPETGVSIADLQRFLAGWLGHETHVRGEVFETPAGLSLTVRAGGAAGDTVGGAASDLDALFEGGAQALFASTQPYRWGIWLEEHGRVPEARAVFGRLADSGPAGEKPWALVGLANLAPDPRRALALAREAARLGPDLALPLTNVWAKSTVLGRDQEAVDAETRAEALLRRPDHGGIVDAGQTSAFAASLNAGAVGDAGDYRSALADLRRFHGRLPAGLKLVRARFLADDHDVAAARSAEPSGGVDAQVNRAVLARGELPALPHWAEAAAAGDWSEGLTGLEAFEPELGEAPPTTGAAGYIAARLWPHEAVALAHLGRLAEARALLDRTPLDSIPALDARGLVAARSGRPAEADRWFAQAVRQAPRLPEAHLAWGQSLLWERRPVRAIAELKLAHEMGPRFADPLEAWGEALLVEGDDAGAARRFAQAAEDAPKWGRDHLLWGEALMLAGRWRAARAQLAIANGLVTSIPDRAKLAVLRARTASPPMGR